MSTLAVQDGTKQLPQQIMIELELYDLAKDATLHTSSAGSIDMSKVYGEFYHGLVEECNIEAGAPDNEWNVRYLASLKVRKLELRPYVEKKPLPEDAPLYAPKPYDRGFLPWAGLQLIVYENDPTEY
jgi:hypothetical protein